EPVVEKRRLGEVAQQPLRVRRAAGVAAYGRLPTAGAVDPDQDLDRGRLARAVDPQVSGDRPARDLERKSREDFFPDSPKAGWIAGAEVLDLNHAVSPSGR